MSEWHHHHVDDTTITFCLADPDECETGMYEIGHCEGVFDVGDEFKVCHWRLLWRDESQSADSGQQAVLPVGLSLVEEEKE